jgi:hypothetical protein
LQYCFFPTLTMYAQIYMMLHALTGQIAVLIAVIAVLLHHCAMDIWTDCGVVSTA